MRAKSAQVTGHFVVKLYLKLYYNMNLVYTVMITI